MNGLVGMYQELKDDFPCFFYLYRRIKKRRVDCKGYCRFIEKPVRLVNVEKRLEFYNGHIHGLQLQKLKRKRKSTE